MRSMNLVLDYQNLNLNLDQDMFFYHLKMFSIITLFQST